MPIKIPKSIRAYIHNDLSKEEICKAASLAYKSLNKGNPEISIVMPAYNESNNIVSALSSLCHNITNKSVEIILLRFNILDIDGMTGS